METDVVPASEATYHHSVKPVVLFPPILVPDFPPTVTLVVCTDAGDDLVIPIKTSLSLYSAPRLKEPDRLVTLPLELARPA
jgi:hypothetical protein